ncbi:PAS domain S-box protein [Desulfonatronum parangueonense]
MASVNQELQYANDLLRASKKELESTNTQLHILIAKLTRVNNDMNNMFAGTGVGTLFVDMQLRIMSFTPPTAKIINLIQEDIGRSVAHIATNLVGNGNLVADIREVMATCVSREMEVRTHAGNWYLMIIHPYNTLDHRIEGVVISFVEITRRKQAENALRENEQRYRLLADHASLFVYKMNNMEGRYEYVSSSATSIIGYDPQDLYNNPRLIEEAIHPESRNFLEEQWRSIQEGKEPDCFEYQIIGKDGKTRWLHQINHFQKDQDGNIIGNFGTIRDISEQKHVELALRESEEKYRLLFKSMPLGVVYLDSNGFVASANPAAERILGLSAHQMVGMSVVDPHWKMMTEGGVPVPPSEYPGVVALRTGKSVGPMIRYVFHPIRNRHVRLSITAMPVFRPGTEHPFLTYICFEEAASHSSKHAPEAFRASHIQVHPGS